MAEPGLRVRLVVAAGSLLEDEGLDGVTLRAIARRAGVSHGAPHRHFPSLAALLSEVAADGFVLLQERVDRAAQGAASGSGALARLAAAGRAYVQTAVEHPALFALMFRPELLSPDVPRLRECSLEAFEQLARLVRAAQDGGWHLDQDARVLAGSLWASVHGLATLWAQGAMSAVTGNESLDEAVTSLLGMVARPTETGEAS